MTDAESDEAPARANSAATGCVAVLAAVAGLAALYVGTFLFLLWDQWYSWNLVFFRLPTGVQEGLTIFYSPLIWLTVEVLDLHP